MDDKNIFATRLKTLMIENNISVSQLARKIQISKELISNYASGKYKAKNQNLYKLARFFDVSPAWLMGINSYEKEIIYESDKIEIFKKANCQITFDDVSSINNFLLSELQKNVSENTDTVNLHNET